MIANGTRKTGHSSILSMYGPPSPLSEPESIYEMAQHEPNKDDHTDGTSPPPIMTPPSPSPSSSFPRPPPFSPSLYSPSMLSCPNPHASNTSAVKEFGSKLPSLPCSSPSSIPINKNDDLKLSTRPSLDSSGTSSRIGTNRRKNNLRNQVHKQDIRNRKPTLCTPGDGKIFCCPCRHKKKQCARILDGKGLLDHLYVFLLW